MVEIVIEKKMPDEYKNLLNCAISNAINLNYRSLIVLSGKNYEKILAYSILSHAKTLYNFKNEIEVLYVTEDFSGDFLKRYENFLEVILDEDLPYLKIKKSKYKNSKENMGKTYDILVLDLYKSLTPDDLGRLIGTVRGGGLIFLLVEDFDNFENIKTTFHEHLLTPPYTIDDVRNIFEKRFKRKLLEHYNIAVYDTEKGVIHKKFVAECTNDVIFPERKRIILPKDIKFSERIYRLAYTQDQVEVLKLLEKLLDKDDNLAFVISADRGRGKSAVLGLTIAALVEKIIESKKRKPIDIGITSPSPDNVSTLFEFLEIGLKSLKLQFKKISSKKYVVNSRIYIEYRRPLDILSKKYDFLFVDEAAGIGVNILKKYTRKYKKVVFSTTTHGYEGAGRSFSVKFMGYLRKQSHIEVFEYKMKEPIRYADKDPIEKWLFDTLLLDAEPPQLDEKDIDLIKKKSTKFYKIPLEKWFEKEEDKLRQFIGIYILAHYQNRPNDVAMIADAPHHDGFALELTSGKIVNALQIAYEGGIPEDIIKRMLKDYKPKGNIIPDVIAKHYRNTEFPKLKGIRIVRIATHPQVQGMGLGSLALQGLTEWARKKNYDWIGSGFGATPELVRFWQKNGFVVVHISPEKNKVSGEYSALVLKPLNESTESIVKRMNYEFRWRLINQATDVFFDMSPELLYELLQTPYEFEPHFPILTTENQLERARAFLKGPMTYEAAADIVRTMFIYYLMYTKRDRPKIDPEYEKVLLAKILLAWSTKKAAKYFNKKPSYIRKAIRKSIKEIYNWIVSKKR